MRYAGQGWEIPVPLEHRDFVDADQSKIFAAFEAAYRSLFGRTIDGLAIEITNWSLVIASVLPAVAKAERFDTGTPANELRMRSFYDAALRKRVDAREVARTDMAAGCVAEGPAVIVENETTTIVTSAYRAIGQGDGSLLLRRKGDTA
jgi:N-methylhydantoinase A